MARFERAPAPVGRCWCCGEEIWSNRDLDLYDGMCETCYLETDEDADTISEEDLRQRMEDNEIVNRFIDRMERERGWRDG